MKNDFMAAIKGVCEERQLSPDVVIQAVEAALVSAYRRNAGSGQNIIAKIDQMTGEVRIFAQMQVVEEVIDDKEQLSLQAARKIKPDAQLGDVIEQESTPKDFGRIAAQTAKQVILQRIREAERDALYTSYVDREGEIVVGSVQSVDNQQVIMALDKVEACLPRSEWIPTERYVVGQRLRAYVAEVSKTPKGPQIIVSRTNRNMLRRLLELEVPEIYNGTVEIKSIAREAGYRSKVAVAALQEGVDPVGSCVGMRGVRIQSIVNELNGEKIDVVPWNQDPRIFIANALSPAKVMKVMLEDSAEGKTATVVVPDRQLSLAIGKEGQNARLAAKLTGWRIDIKSHTEAIEDALRKISENDRLKELLLEKQDVITLARSINEERGGEDMTDGEIQAISRAIEAVHNAEQIYIQEERELAAKEAAKRNADLIAKAEALLMGKASLEDLKTGKYVVTPEEREEAVAAGEEAQPVEAAAPAEPEAEIIPEATVIEEAAVPVAGAEIAVSSLAEELIPEDLLPELTIKPAAEDETTKEKPRKKSLSELEWPIPVDVEEVEEDELDKDKKKKKKKKGQQLLFDEQSGQVISKKHRKPSRRRGVWDEFLDDES